MTQKATILTSPIEKQVSPPTTPQTRTSPRRSNSSTNHQSPPTRVDSIDLFLKTHEIIWFWYPILQQSLSPDKQRKSLATLFQHISDYFHRDEDIHEIISNCIESYILIIDHLPITTKQLIETTVTSDVPDQLLLKILRGENHEIIAPWHNLSYQIHHILKTQSPLQPLIILHNIRNTLIPIVTSIKQRLSNTIDYPRLSFPRHHTPRILFI